MTKKIVRLADADLRDEDCRRAILCSEHLKEMRRKRALGFNEFAASTADAEQDAVASKTSKGWFETSVDLKTGAVTHYWADKEHV